MADEKRTLKTNAITTETMTAEVADERTGLVVVIFAYGRPPSAVTSYMAVPLYDVATAVQTTTSVAGARAFPMIANQRQPLRARHRGITVSSEFS